MAILAATGAGPDLIRPLVLAKAKHLSLCQKEGTHGKQRALEKVSFADGQKGRLVDTVVTRWPYIIALNQLCFSGRNQTHHTSIVCTAGINGSKISGSPIQNTICAGIGLQYQLPSVANMPKSKFVLTQE